MPTHLENSAVATGLDKISFHSNPKERQYQRMLKLPCNCIHLTHYHGEGNGNPLQRSCLENPRDRGAWWAAVYGVAQSRTRLKRLSSSSSFFLPLCWSLQPQQPQGFHLPTVGVQWMWKYLPTDPNPRGWLVPALTRISLTNIPVPASQHRS